MKSRLFTLSALASLIFLTGCNVPLVPLIQSDSSHHEIQIDEPTQEIFSEAKESLQYADSKTPTDKNITPELAKS
jgi:outer membrane lipopolysaccharide assembly protein LptE/RlpB